MWEKELIINSQFLESESQFLFLIIILVFTVTHTIYCVLYHWALTWKTSQIAILWELCHSFTSSSCPSTRVLTVQRWFNGWRIYWKNTAWRCFWVILSLKPVKMEKSTNSSVYEWGYEYYYGYVDPVAVDASKLKYNRCEFVLCLKWINVSNAYNWLWYAK